MAALEKYRHYFNIDPEYFPQVNKAIIDDNPDMWKKFYPHETFVKLIKDTISVISRKQKVSIWVEGAYGTGKSYAVLTLKKLLDASESDTREYFEKYQDQMGTDLFNQFQQQKDSDKKILTVHRYGSSSIHGDSSLVFAIQNSIDNALKENGMEASAQGVLKFSAIKWLSDEANKAYFNTLVDKNYSDIFAGDDVDTIISKLETYTGESLQELMCKIMKVAEERQFQALSLDVDGLVDWIRAVIKENNLKAIVFIWDEFTEYFRNNMRALTGFQKLADLSGSDPFYFILVTHNVTHIFPETDNDWKKILGRFVNPICNIELPENIAFRLMGAAMEKNSDTQVLSEWEDTSDELYDRTTDSRQLVKGKARITDNELKNILPIHPYTALLLKHISSAFDSNQRSMFDFIKNDRGDEIKGFQWFIDNCSPFDDNPLLTIDMLWDFFYEKGKEYLSHDIRSILDCYARAATKSLDNDERKVLRTALLLQAISQKVGDTVELFIPDEKNINNSFEGSDLENGAASRLADKLVRDNILYKKQMGNGKSQYSALVNAGDSAAIEKNKEDVLKKNTSTLVAEGDVASAITLGGALKQRYILKYAAVNDFKQTINFLRNQGSVGNHIVAVVTFAKDDSESALIAKNIQEAVKDGSYPMIFVDASTSPLGSDLLEQYADAMANAMYQRGKDNTQANQYENNARDVLKKWKNKIANGEFIIYNENDAQGVRATTIDQLYMELSAINKKRFSCGLETGNAVTDAMWAGNSLPAGVECGAKQVTAGQYKSGNPQTKLENYIGDEAWGVDKYWEKNPYTPISKIKHFVDDTISQSFDSEGRIAISRIYEALKDEPYGFMPCNLTAFVLGFILKEYTDGTFSWSDGVTNDVMTIAKLKEMVAEIIKHQTTPIPRYKEKYIVTMTDAERAFNSASSTIFGISLSLCTSIEQTRERIRQKMKELSFPIWCLKSILDKVELKSNGDKVSELIDRYSGIANNSNFGDNRTDSDIALSIGSLCMDTEGIVDDLKSILTKEKCTEGMNVYLHSFEDGLLIRLADEVGDGGQYINRLRKKFDADAANWVWNVSTAEQKIQEVILEYQIISESNKILPKNIAFDNCIHEWCDKCDYIRISYLYAKNSWGELTDLMGMLYDMKKSNILQESQKQKFLTLIQTNGIAFNNFYNNQTDVFKEVCGFFLEQYQFANEDISEIFKLLPLGQFTRDKAEYQKTVQDAITTYLSDSLGKQLKDFWREKTGTATPREWSQKYTMPILCMVPDEDVQKAREAFGAINKKQSDNASIERSLAFLKKADFISKLESKEERDIAFKQKIIKRFNVMLDDIDEVKTYLDKVITPTPYDWYGLPEIDKKLEKMAEVKYTQNGCNKALEKIENMELSDVKHYLRELIKDNMNVGMEIIKNN